MSETALTILGFGIIAAIIWTHIMVWTRWTGLTNVEKVMSIISAVSLALIFLGSL